MPQSLMKITISGLPGAGKGELRKNIENEYSIKSFSVGDLRREFATQRGLTIQELNKIGETDPSTDKEADAYQQQWAQLQENFILEGRLSYHFIPKSIKLFLTVDPEIGAQRILEAKRHSEIKTATLQEQIKINQQRCESDIQRYLQIYSIENCYDKKNFDIIIDTSNKTLEEVLKSTKRKITQYTSN